MTQNRIRIADVADALGLTGQQERGDGTEKRYGTEVKHIFTQCGDSYGPRPVCR